MWGCFVQDGLTDDGQFFDESSTISGYSFKPTNNLRLIKRPIRGQAESQVWLDHACSYLQKFYHWLPSIEDYQAFAKQPLAQLDCQLYDGSTEAISVELQTMLHRLSRGMYMMMNYL